MSPLARGIRLGVFWTTLAWVMAAAPAQAQRVRITEIELRGNQRVEAKTILGAISQRKGEFLSVEGLERDRQAVEKLGFFRAVSTTLKVEGDAVRVTFSLQEYPVVKAIEVTGSSLFTGKEIIATLKTRTDQVFNLNAWSADQAAIQKLYNDKGAAGERQGGYIIRLESNALPTAWDPGFETPEAMGILRLRILELRVGKVTLRFPIQASKPRRERLLTEWVLPQLDQKTGVLFNSRMVAADYQKIVGLAYFDTVNPVISVSEGPDAVMAADIVWELAEKQIGAARGLGAQRPKLKVSPDGFPVGHGTPEGAACDLARAYIRRDPQLFRTASIPPFGGGPARKQYEAFLDKKAAEMRDPKKPRSSTGAVISPKAIGKVFAARPLSGGRPEPEEIAEFGLLEVGFVDVGVLLSDGRRRMHRTLVLRTGDGKWFAHPKPDSPPLLGPGLSDELPSTTDFSDAYTVTRPAR